MESSRAARRNHRARSSRRRPLPYIALAAAAVVGVTAGGTVYVKAHAHSDVVSSAAAAPSASASASGSREATVEPVTQPTVDYDGLLAKAMKSVTPTGDQKVSVAVLDLTSGESATYGGTAFDTASIVKVDILATLLLQAQDAGRQLTATEKSYATTMIENSDNDSASALWRIIGKAGGLDAANKTLGLSGTTGGDDMLWGLTQTTAADQLTLLQQVFGDDSKLSSASQSYIQGLMKQIEADQQWGVSAAADGSKWALKNGWLARSTTGLWDVNSIGRVTGEDGDTYLVAVLSKGSTTQTKGISLIEAAAKAGVAAFGKNGGSSTTASASASASASD
ncbi:serine hydrolase [Streptomyces prunicolor]|uniref:serine hydrolase n=1 Tax=Streptomyces prunicolor TaxID=67348 RepID=UPI00037514CF|nr:serine hydrolase [Streptomyces prunicolor]